MDAWLIVIGMRTTSGQPHANGLRRTAMRVTGSGHVLALLAALLLGACAAYEPRPLTATETGADIATAARDGITVSTTLLTDAQARQLYGVDLADVGLQAIWLKVQNDSDHARWLLVSALDAEYFAPDEAAILFHGKYGDADEQRVTERFRELAMPMKAPAGATVEGYVLAPRQEGGRYVSVPLYGSEGLLTLGFAVTLPDGEFDFERLQPDRIYAGAVLPSLDLPDFRSAIEGLPCCTSNEAGDGDGDPVNLVLVGDIDEVLTSLSRADWSFTHRIGLASIRRMVSAALLGNPYSVAPVSDLYLFGRSQDIALQHSRSTILQRNHLRLWLAPFRFQDRPVWVGQVSRDIDVKATTRSPTLTTHVIDPNLDEARQSLLQGLISKGAIDRFGFAAGQAPVTQDAPYRNLADDPYFTDGLRLVAMLTGSRTTPPEQIVFFDWYESADPIQAARPTEPAPGR